MEAGNKRNPSSLVVWLGDNPKAENQVLKDLPAVIGTAGLISVSWSQHPAGEGLFEFSLNAPEVVDGSWYMRDRSNFENEDLDMLHDVELLGRSMVEAIEPKLQDYGLEWKNVVFMGFGKGAGIILYAMLMKLISKPAAGMILFSPIAPFPGYLSEKLGLMKRGTVPVKLFTIWGNRNRATPGSYRTLLTSALRKAPEVHATPDTLPEGDHSFDGASMSMLTTLLPLCLR
jgi:predicted esterase